MQCTFSQNRCHNREEPLALMTSLKHTTVLWLLFTFPPLLFIIIAVGVKVILLHHPVWGVITVRIPKEWGRYCFTGVCLLTFQGVPPIQLMEGGVPPSGCAIEINHSSCLSTSGEGTVFTGVCLLTFRGGGRTLEDFIVENGCVSNYVPVLSLHLFCDTLSTMPTIFAPFVRFFHTEFHHSDKTG